MEISVADLGYVARIDEVLWGIVLIAINMTLHGYGMLIVQVAATGVGRWTERFGSVLLGGITRAMIAQRRVRTKEPLCS